ncbi:conserved hypothetical protein [Solidesulfovibrio fructosivorans JJ]]|uniref:Uncharacterized protein n=1 Tax=Solidesulfovibrio fructosivorans JJ] TaxID=596151 RepID=E1JU62_SOLFR|nr:hypothetical protein [Solidesulfovibrio fructosivorans]EFL51992.1 conserved hypothetical protein [Solidesulfovibrio fructosivorans JJ]]
MGPKHGRIIVWLVVWTLLGQGIALAGDAETIGPKGVWKLPEAAWTDCLQKAQDATDCLARIMRQTGATPEALAVNKMLDGEGYMETFQEMGRVDVAVMVFPLRANTNAVTYLVNGSPTLVSSEIEPADLPLAADPTYAALQKAHPELMFWPTGEGPSAVDTPPGGGQGFVFTYPLLNGCHACAVLGQALLSLDFGPDGTYHGPRLLRVEAAR